MVGCPIGRGKVPLEPIDAALLVVDALEGLGIPYLIGGSLASALHGVVRATLDAAVLADMHPQHAEPFTRALGEAFYVDADMIRQAIRQRTSFNVIHLETMFKVDVFIPKDRPFDQVQLGRRQAHTVSRAAESRAYFATPEDVVLSKLEWYRMGGEQSGQQWRDVLGVLKAQGALLDHTYLRHWAQQLRISDLLDRALTEAGSGKG
jgi:hypothetical protein